MRGGVGGGQGTGRPLASRQPVGGGVRVGGSLGRRGIGVGGRRRGRRRVVVAGGWLPRRPPPSCESPPPPTRWPRCRPWRGRWGAPAAWSSTPAAHRPRPPRRRRRQRSPAVSRPSPRRERGACAWPPCASRARALGRGRLSSADGRLLGRRTGVLGQRPVLDRAHEHDQQQQAGRRRGEREVESAVGQQRPQRSCRAAPPRRAATRFPLPLLLRARDRVAPVRAGQLGGLRPSSRAAARAAAATGSQAR